MRQNLWQLMRLMVVAAVGLAQSGWTGNWKNDKVEMTIEARGDGGARGTIVFEGQRMPFEGKVSGEKMDGTFKVEGNSFAFTLYRGDRGEVKLTTDGVDYILEPVRSGAKNPLGGRVAAPVPSSSIVGDWQGPQGVVRFGADGSVIIAGKPYKYTIEGSTLTLIAPDGQAALPFQLNGDTMVVSMNGQSIRFTRLAAGAVAVQGQNGVRQELVGKWCYQANVYATNGGARSSSQCFVLNPNGTYEYYGETDSYNPNGGSTGQSYDAGTWTATETTITANSRTRGTTTYRLEKRNHPKNVNDPMLVLDGQAFVTAYQKAPWR